MKACLIDYSYYRDADFADIKIQVSGHDAKNLVGKSFEDVCKMILGGFDVSFEKVLIKPKGQPVTVVFWNDHTKTVVKCQEGDTFSEEAGVALCFMKKMLGNKGNYNKVLREALDKAKRQGE